MLLTARVLEHASREIIFFLNLTKSAHHARWILPSADSRPSIPHSFPDLNCKTITPHKQKVECRPLRSWPCATTLGLCVDITNTSGGSEMYPPRAPRWQAASTRASFSLPFLLFPLPALMLLALSGAGREQQKPRQQLSVGEYKQDASAPGFSRRASLEWHLTAYRWLSWAQTQVAWVCRGHFWKAKTPGMWIQTGHSLGENFAANVVL